MTIYQTAVRGEKKWCLSFAVDGKRLRRFFDSKTDAEIERDVLSDQRQNSGEVWMALSASERNEVLSVYGEARDSGYSLRQILEEWKQSRASRAIPSQRITLGKAVALAIAVRTAENCRPRHLTSLKWFLKRFSKAREERFADEVTTAELDLWFNGKKWAPVTRKTYIALLSSMFDVLRSRQFVTVNPCEPLLGIRLDQGSPRIFTPDEAKRLLKAAREKEPSMLRYFVLAMFEAVRPDAVRRLESTAIDEEHGLLTISSGISKVRHSRIIELMEVTKLWLSACPPAGAFVAPQVDSTFRRRRARVCKAAGITWHHDILRHTGASYLLAKLQDSAKVAYRMSTSVAILETRYKNLVKPKACEEFWGLVPEAKPK